MTKKNVIALVGTAVVLAGAAVFMNNCAKPKTPKLAGKAILPAFSVADVARIEVGDKLILAAGAEGWTIESLHGYPADREKITENVLKLGELKVGQIARGRTIANPMVLTLKDAAGKELAELPMGEQHFRKVTGQSAMYGGGSYPDGRYVSFAGETVLVKDALEAFDGDPKKWCSTRIASVPSADVESVSFAHTGETVVLDKGTNGVWTLQGLGPKEELDTSKTYLLDSALSYLDFVAVADPKLTEAELGFATGFVYTVMLKGGTNHIATVGNRVKDGSDRYFKLDGGKWIYTISSYAAESMMKTRKDLVKAKDEPKPDADAKPETNADEKQN